MQPACLNNKCSGTMNWTKLPIRHQIFLTKRFSQDYNYTFVLASSPYKTTYILNSVNSPQMILPYATLISNSMALRKKLHSIKGTCRMIQIIQTVNKKLTLQGKAYPLPLTSFWRTDICLMLSSNWENWFSLRWYTGSRVAITSSARIESPANNLLLHPFPTHSTKTFSVICWFCAKLHCISKQHF